MSQIKELTKADVFRLLPRRAPDANKGSCGTVVAAAGSTAYRGAAALCAEGALRGGAGLVYLASVEDVFAPVLARMPECCLLPCRPGPGGCLCAGDAALIASRFAQKSAVLLAGPGLGAGAGPAVSALLNGRWAGAVLDADALNALAQGDLPGTLPQNAVLTPHPGEMARLTRTDVPTVQTTREATAAAYAKAHGCVLVLKGSGTVVAAPDGRLWRNPTGNAGLARGGSGDILAGLVAALLAQGLPAAEAACCGVWLHGAAADRCAARKSKLGMLPHDIFEDLCQIFLEFEQTQVCAPPCPCRVQKGAADVL